jgi:hypothetical protein
MDFTETRKLLEQPGNVYEHIRKHGDDEEFIPQPCQKPSRKIPGTPERIQLYAERLINGEELWHPEDYVLTENIDEDLRELYRRLTPARRIRHPSHYGHQ